VRSVIAKMASLFIRVPSTKSRVYGLEIEQIIRSISFLHLSSNSLFPAFPVLPIERKKETTVANTKTKEHIIFTNYLKCRMPTFRLNHPELY